MTRPLKRQKKLCGWTRVLALPMDILAKRRWKKGNIEAAIEAFRKNVSLEPANLARKAELANAYFRAGKQKEGEEIIEEFRHLEGKQYVSSYDWAMIYAGQRDKAQTMKWLELSYEERNARLANLLVHPQFAFLRGDARFQKLLSQMGLFLPPDGKINARSFGLIEK